MKRTLYPYLILLLMMPLASLAQTQDPDELLRQAIVETNQNKNYSRAMDLVKQGQAISPRYADFYLLEGRLHLLINNNQSGARAAFNKVIELQPAYTDAYIQLANLELAENRPEEALRWINSGLQQKPSDPDLLNRKARILEGQQRYAEALDLYKGLPPQRDFNESVNRLRILAARELIAKKEYDAALVYVNQVLENDPTNQDALLMRIAAEADRHPQLALQYTEQALRVYPDNRDYQLRRVYLLRNMEQFPEAYRYALEMQRQFPADAAVNTEVQNLYYPSRRNGLELTNTLTLFDREEKEPWNMFSLGYFRHANRGSVGIRFNLANRFGQSGLLTELEAYPKFRNRSYAYLNLGFSNGTLFPKLRSGLSYFFPLSTTWEAELGARYLNVNSTLDPHIFTYLAGIGHYFGNNWINLRTFLTPSESGLSNSYSLTTRFYGSSKENYLTFGAGWGSSPDERSRGDFESRLNLSSYRLNAGFQRLIRRTTTLGFQVFWNNTEYVPNRRDNEFDLFLSLQRRF